MKILAIDTSSNNCTAAILDNTTPLISMNNIEEKTHSQKLMPMIDTIFQETHLSLDDIDLLACCIGPGSFTGIRIGIATIKAFADVKNLPVVGVSSLEILAYQAKSTGYIATMLDAKNENIYFAFWHFSDTKQEFIIEPTAMTIAFAMDTLQTYQEEPIYFIGDATTIYHSFIQAHFPYATFSSSEENRQSSIFLGKCAYQKYQNNQYGSSNSLLPTYLKKSQAERWKEGEK